MSNINPSLDLAIDRLNSLDQEHFAIWVLKSPEPSGRALNHCVWSENLSQGWLTWLEMFGSTSNIEVPLILNSQPKKLNLPLETNSNSSYSSRLMQHFGILLWQWVFNGDIQNSLAKSQGIALGQSQPLRLRLEIRDPNLIAVPWEIMQSQPGTPPISLNQQILFSRTTSYVDRLSPIIPDDYGLKILLVLGQNDPNQSSSLLELEQESATLIKILQNDTSNAHNLNTGPLINSQVHTLIQPTPAELIRALENTPYNIFFYAGHGVPGPDGGWLFLKEGETVNGTQLAQVLVRSRVKLAVFNACWLAFPVISDGKTVPRSSLAEVLIHHGVPSVLGMRDRIADPEALCFIEYLTQALLEGNPIDQSVAIARQNLLSIYKYNQPVWTLPVLYMHPEYDGRITRSMEEGITEIPDYGSLTQNNHHIPTAWLRSLESSEKVWQIRGNLMQIGREPKNDVVIPERWVSRKHAKIICRPSVISPNQLTYFLRDISSHGTFILTDQGWEAIHDQEVPLKSGNKLKFGSTSGQVLEFLIDE